MKTKMMIFGGMMLAMMAQVWALTSSPVRVDTRTTYGRYLATGVELVGEPDGSSIRNWDTTEFSAIEGDGWNRLTSSDGSRISVRVINESAVVHGGRLAVSEIWSADKVHVVRSNVVVPDGVTLTLETDAVVKFVPGASIATEGTGSLVVRGARCADISDDYVGGDTDMNETDDFGEAYGDYEQVHTTLSDWFAENVMPVAVNVNFQEWDGPVESFTRYYTRGLTLGDLPEPSITESPLWEYKGWIVSGTSDAPEYVNGSMVVQGGMDIQTYYQQIVSYTVTFDLGEYGVHTGGELVQRVKDGEKAVAPEFEVMDGWSFTGWDNNVTTPITGDITFVAQYDEIIKEPEMTPNREVSIDVDEMGNTGVEHLTLTVTAGETIRFNYDLGYIDGNFFGYGDIESYSFGVFDEEGNLLEEFEAYNGYVDWTVPSDYQGPYYAGVYSPWDLNEAGKIDPWFICGYEVTVISSEVEDTTPTFDSRVVDMSLCEYTWNDMVVYSGERLRFWLSEIYSLNGAYDGYKAVVVNGDTSVIIRYLDVSNSDSDPYIDWVVLESEGRYWVGFVAESEIKSSGRGDNCYYYANTLDPTLGAYFNVSSGSAEGLHTVKFKGALPRMGGGALIQRIPYGGAAEEPQMAYGPVNIDGEECVFKGWDSDAWMNVTSDMTINAIYAPETVEPATYAVTFDLGAYGTRTGGGELTQSVVEGECAVAPTVQAMLGWKFTGWNRDFSEVRSNLTISAVYEEEKTTSGIPYSWFKENGLIADGEDIDLDSLETIDSDNDGYKNGTEYWCKTNPMNEHSHFEILGVHSNGVTYVTMGPCVKGESYTLLFSDLHPDDWDKSNDGDGLVNNNTVGYMPVEAESDGLITVENFDADFVLRFYSVGHTQWLNGTPWVEIKSTVPQAYTVTFDLGEYGTRMGGGELTQSVVEGECAVAPTVQATLGWKFTGWTPDVSSAILCNTTFVAQYEELPTSGGGSTIRSIDPCDQYGNVIENGSIAQPYTAGQTAYFRIRLENANSRESWETKDSSKLSNPWTFEYVGAGDAALEWAINPPKVGVYVSGQLRGATVVSALPPADKGWYTDILCSYTVRPGDLALPMTLANQAGKEMGDGSASEYYLDTIPRSGAWRLMAYERESASTWDTVVATNTCTFKYGETQFFNTNASAASEMTEWTTDYALKQAGLYLKSVDFAAAEYSVAQGRTEKVNVGIVGGVNTNGNGTVYAMVKDGDAVALAEDSVEVVTVAEDPNGDTNVAYQVAKVTIPSGADVDSFSFKVKGVTEGAESTVYLSTTKSFTYGDSHDLVTNFVTAVVKCVEPPPPYISITLDGAASKSVTSNANYTDYAAKLTVTLSEAHTSDVTVDVTPAMVSNNGTDPLGKYIGMSTYSENGFLEKVSTVAFTAAEMATGTLSKDLYVYVLGADDQTDGVGKGIIFKAANVAIYNNENVSAILYIKKSTPQIQYPAEGQSYSGLAGGVASAFTIKISDDYTNMQSPFTVEWLKTGSGTPQTISGVNVNSDGEAAVSVRYNVGEYTTRFRVKNAAGVWSDYRTINVHVNPARRVSAVVTNPADVDEFDETFGEISVRFALTEAYEDCTLYAFLVPQHAASSNLAVSTAFDTGIAIRSGNTNSTDTAKIQLLDGTDETQPLTYSIALRTAKTWDAGETIGIYESKDLEIYINNVAPKVLAVNMSGSAPVTVSGGTFSAKPFVGLRRMFTIDVDDVVADLAADMISVWTFTDSNGNAKSVRVSAPLDEIVLTNVFEVAGTYSCSVKLRDKDMPENVYGETFSFNVKVLATPSVNITFPGSNTFNESDAGRGTACFNVELSTPATRQIDVVIESTRSGSDSVLSVAQNTVTFRAGETSQQVLISEMDGTANSVSFKGGFSVTAKVVTETLNEDGIALKDVYLPVTEKMYVANEAPTILSPIDTGVTNDASTSVQYLIAWEIDDVYSDLTNGLTVTWTTSEGITQTFVGSDVYEGVFTNVFTSAGDKTVTMTVTDKDGGMSSKSLHYRVGEYYHLEIVQPVRGGSITGGSSGPQPVDSMLMLTRKADTGYHIVGWTGDVEGLYQWGDSLAVVMDMPRTIGLAVAPDAYAITYADTRGAANPNPVTYTIEDEVAFAPLPDVTGWKFIGWSQASIPAGSMGAVTVTAQWVPAECSVTIGGEETKVTWGSEVTFCAPEPFVDELCKTQIVCVGTTFTDPVVTNEFTVTVTNDIDFTWDILATNYWFETAQTQNGMIEAPGAGWKPYEETFLISAIPTNHYHFVTWTGDTEGCVATNGNGLVVTMDRARSIGVEFAIDTFTVLFKAGAHGSLSGKTVQTVAYGGNAEVPSVDPHVGYRFVGWSGDVTAPVTGNRTFEAEYATIPYNITYTELKGSANSNPATYMVEDEIVFAPLPDVEGWNFVGWSPSSIAKGSTGAKTVVAQWERMVHSVNVGGVSTNVIYGTEITFRAPAPFVDELCKTQIVCVGTTFTDPVVTNEFTVTVTNDIDFTWNIFATNYWLEVESAELGVIDGVANGWQAAGSAVALTAVADAGCRHYRWLGDISGCAADGNVLGVVMDRARTIGARFAYDVRAVIDSASPQNPTEDSHILLQGHGEGGVVTEHHWKAVNLSDGSVSELSRAQACRVRLGVGEWRLEYRVKDSTGIWSDPATMSVTVTGMEQVIDLQVCRTGVTFIDSIGLPTSNVQTGDVVAVRVKVQNRGNTHMSEGATVYLCDGILPVDEMTDLTEDDPRVLASGRISRLNIGRSQTVSMTWNVGKTNSGSVRTYDEGPNAFTVAVVPDSESDVETVIDNNLVTTMLEVGESDVPLAEIFNISAKYEEKVFGGADYSVSGKVWYERDGVKVYVAGATLTFIVDGEVAGSCETDDSGNYVWMFAAPDKGEHTISVKAMDGNVVKAIEGSFVSEERPSTGGGSGGDEENPDDPEEPVLSVKTANLKVLSFICTGDGITDRNGNVYSASLGGEVTFDAVVRNAGQIAVTNAFSVKITDNTNGDILAYAVSTNGLAVGEELSVSLDEPFVLENAGRYGYRITVDEEGLVDESSETDNESKVWITVEEPLPNLIVTDMTFSDTQPLEGEELVVRAKVRNVGDVPCPAGVRVVLNANGSMSEMVLSDELAVDASADVVYSIIPAEGILRMFIEADCLDEIAESDETDNRLSRTLAIYSVNADVKPVSLVADPYPKAGEPCVLTAVFRNDGGASYQGGTAVFFVDDSESGKIAEVAVGPIAWKGGVGNATCVWTPEANADRIIGVMIDGKVYSATYSATPPPDLRVTAEDISFEPGTPSGGDTVKFRAMLRNVSGNTAATNATVVFAVTPSRGDESHLTTMVVPYLAPGGSVAVDADLTYAVERGVYAVKVSVMDSTGKDAYTSDNVATRTFGVNMPMAVTGPDVACIAGDTVTLDGSASTDATQWFWSLVEAPVGNEASVVDASASVTTFTPQIAGLYRFELVVSDGIQESESTECTVLVDRVRVTASASYGGVIDPAGEQVQLAGSAPVYAATEARGYSFNCFRLDGVCVTNEHSAYTFAPLDRNHEIEACFSAVAYPVTYAETKGAMNGNPTTYTVEDEIVFAPLPDVEGWRFTGWQPVSIEKGTIGSMTVTAQWERTVHGVTVGGVSTNVVYGTEMTFRAPEPWVDETCTTQIVYVGTSFTSPVVTNGFTVVVTNDVEFSWDVLATNYWLEVSATEGGSVDFDEGWINAGARKVVSASAEFSYRFVRWEGDVTESQAASVQTAVVMDRTRSLKAVFERIPITVGEAANAPDYNWYTEGDAEWAGEWSKSAADGIHAARSGAVGHSQETVLGLRLEGAGTLSFDWRASCEERFDAVRLEIDGSLVRVLSGETSWTNVCIELGLGEHDIRWVYKKGRSGSAGEDAVWVDNVAWTSAAEPTLAEALGDFDWETEGDVQWNAIRSEYAYEGNSFAMAEGLGDYGASVVRTKVSGAGRLMFQWAVSCEESYDWFDFLVDGEVVEMVTGETNWRKVTVDLGEGEHILEWAYWKDEMDDPELVGANCAMLDHVQWYPAGEEPPELGGRELDEFFEWLKTHSQIAATATKQDAQGVFLAGTAAVGKAVPLYAEFLSGTNPNDPTSEFRATIEFKDGLPVVSPSPDLGTARRYTVYGKKDIGDANEAWTPVGEGDESNFNFFKVTVDMP